MGVRSLLLALVAVAGLAACQPEPAAASEDVAQPVEQQVEPPTGPDVTPVDAEACAAQGGEVKPVCRLQRPMCVIANPDAGKACSDPSDCGGGRCFAAGDAPAGAATGTCAPSNDPCGCYTAIENGVAQPTICVD